VRNPYLIDGPAVISFSGGRSSGFMLWNILEAHDHKLPEDIKVIFCNTGLEHHETYEFIHRIEENWCPVIWLEYCLEDTTKKNSFKMVDYFNASRNGDPFDAVIKKYKYLPNPRNRFCTGVLKIQTEKKYLKSLGWNDWNKVLGLRSDEPRRVSRMRLKEEDVLMPMADVKHTQEDVLDFWRRNALDMDLPLEGNIWSNCVGCFLKGYGKLIQIAEEQPKELDWWIEKELETSNVFRRERPPYKRILKDSKTQIEFSFEETIPCFCTD